MTTTWKTIEDYPNYEISNDGQVRNKTNGHIIQSDQVTLVNGKDRSCVRVRTNLMPKYWKFEWIKELLDDEEVTEMEGFPGYYITSKGRIFNLRRYSWTKMRVKSNGSYGCRISRKEICIKRQVAKHFHPDYNESKIVSVIDDTLPLEERYDVNNLCIGDWSVPFVRSCSTGTKQLRFSREIIDKVIDRVNSGATMTGTAKEFGMTLSYVSRIMSGQRRTLV